MSNFQMEHIRPDGLFKSPVYSQAITVRGNSKTIYIGGQDSVNAKGEIVGKDDLAAQTRQIIDNIGVILAAEKASFKDLVKLNIYMVQGVDPRVGLRAFQESVGALENPPLVTGLFVAGLARPEFLIEIDGIAVVEDK